MGAGTTATVVHEHTPNGNDQGMSTTGTTDAHLRPIERRVLALRGEGVDDIEIARRFRRSPRFIGQVARLAELEGRDASGEGDGDELRPLERCVLQWRARGVPPSEIGPRFRRSSAFVDRVEQLANYKLRSSA
jgi:hypothetical protein